MLKERQVLRDVMKKKRVSQGFVADALGIPRQSLANWLHYENDEKNDRISQIADILNCDVRVDIVLVDRETGEIYR